MTHFDKEISARLDGLFGRHEVYYTFFTNLKKAVSAGDKKTVAAMVDCPTMVSIGGKGMTTKSGKDFVPRHDHIFIDKIVTAIEKQAYADLFRNSQSMMIENGSSPSIRISEHMG